MLWDAALRMVVGPQRVREYVTGLSKISQREVLARERCMRFIGHVGGVGSPAG